MIRELVGIQNGVYPTRNSVQNLYPRYKKKHGLDQDPAKIEIITENPYVMRKFKKAVSKMLANC